MTWTNLWNIWLLKHWSSLLLIISFLFVYIIIMRGFSDHIIACVGVGVLVCFSVQHLQVFLLHERSCGSKKNRMEQKGTAAFS